MDNINKGMIILLGAMVIVLITPRLIRREQKKVENEFEKSSFALFGQKILNEAISKSEAEALVSENGKGSECFCITGYTENSVNHVFMKSTGKYIGIVEKIDEEWYVTIENEYFLGTKMTYNTLNDFKTNGVITNEAKQGTVTKSPKNKGSNYKCGNKICNDIETTTNDTR